MKNKKRIRAEHWSASLVSESLTSLVKNILGRARQLKYLRKL
jgi:hypothetical protein